MAICRQACPYNTLDGCKVKEHGGVCQLTNTAQPITEYRMTNADRIRNMSDEELATHLHDIGWDCHLCAEHGRLDNEPLLRGEKCDEKCVEHCLEWLQIPAEESDNETVGERKDGDGNG